MITRAQIQTLLQGYKADEAAVQNKATFTSKITTYLNTYSDNPTEKTQILNDLESYAEYHTLNS